MSSRRASDTDAPDGMTRSTPTALSRLTWVAAGLSVFASLLHGLVTQEHFDEWWGYGAFFVVAAVAQMGYAAVLILAPWRDGSASGLLAHLGRRAETAFYLLGVAGNAAIVALYVVTRAIGIPFFGPEAGAVEPIGPIDALSKVTEVALIGVLLRMHRLASREADLPPSAQRTRRPPPPSRR
jgi:hypothetical protein